MDIWQFLLHIAVALVLGMLIGLERQVRQHPAGLRTNALLCLGAALFVSLSLMLDQENSPTRVASQVASGVGFLCGGVILREGFNVKGMTTAATMWCSAAVGTLAGTGQLLAATIGTAAILIVNLLLRPVVKRLTFAHMHIESDTVYRLRLVCSIAAEEPIRKKLTDELIVLRKLAVQRLSSQLSEAGDRVTVQAELYATTADDPFVNDLATRLGREPGVTYVGWENLHMHQNQ